MALQNMMSVQKKKKILENMDEIIVNYLKWNNKKGQLVTHSQRPYDPVRDHVTFYDPITDHVTCYDPIRDHKGS